MIEDIEAAREKLEKRLKKEGDCLVWTGGIDKALNCGKILIEGKTYLVHRLAWELYGEKLGKGKRLEHICENALCCRREHLRLQANFTVDRPYRKLMEEAEKSWKNGKYVGVGQISEEMFESYVGLYGEPEWKGIIAVATYSDHYFSFRVDRNIEVRGKMRIWADGKREYFKI